MRAVVQRVNGARVSVAGETVGAIGPGLVVLLGVGREDAQDAAAYLAEKVAGLRIFADAGGKMNLSLREAGGEALVVSQFTLWGDCRKGRRPNFTAAAAPEIAERLYQDFISCLANLGVPVQSGCFGAHMTLELELVNDGPVTVLLDSQRLF